MDIETIKNTVSEITSEIDNMRNSEMIENALEELEHLSTQLEDLAEEGIDDVDYEEIIEEIANTREALTDSLDALYEEEDYEEEDGYGSDDDDDDY